MTMWSLINPATHLPSLMKTRNGLVGQFMLGILAMINILLIFSDVKVVQKIHLVNCLPNSNFSGMGKGTNGMV